jgi:hypothetical protein
MNRRGTRGRRVALIAGLGLAAIAVVAVVEWPVLKARYHAWRLDRARTWAEAEPWLAAAARDSQDPRAARTFVALLGLNRQWATYWFFAELVRVAPEDAADEGFPNHLERDLTLLTELESRLQLDEGLLRLWADFDRNVHPFKTDFLTLMVRAAMSPAKRAHLRQLGAGSPRRTQGAIDSLLLLSSMDSLAAAWLLGAEQSRPATWKESTRLPGAMDEREIKKRIGIGAARPVRFDERLGRYVADPSGAPARGVPPPPPALEKPFQFWKGPVPEPPPGRVLKI